VKWENGKNEKGRIVLNGRKNKTISVMVLCVFLFFYEGDISRLKIIIWELSCTFSGNV